MYPRCVVKNVRPRPCLLNIIRKEPHLLNILHGRLNLWPRPLSSEVEKSQPGLEPFTIGDWRGFSGDGHIGNQGGPVTFLARLPCRIRRESRCKPLAFKKAMKRLLAGSCDKRRIMLFSTPERQRTSWCTMIYHANYEALRNQHLWLRHIYKVRSRAFCRRIPRSNCQICKIGSPEI